MFFGVQILGRKQPLSTAWLLGCGRKITKRKVMKEDILKTCEMIMQPVVPLALRLSAVLMSGVILLFHQKQQYILDDCHDALRSARSAARRSKHRDDRTTIATSKATHGRTEDTVTRTRTTFRSRGEARGGEVTVNDVSRHVEEIFLQEFLSTQPASDDLRMSVDKRSLEFFSSGSGLKSASREEGSFSYNPSISAGGQHVPGAAVASSLDSQPIDLQIGEDTFLQPHEEETTMKASYDDDLMKDFFFTTNGDEQNSERNHQDNSNSDNAAQVSAQASEQEEPLQHTAEAQTKKKRRYRKRKRNVKIQDDGFDVTLPRETIREWLKDASDIICNRPLFERKGPRSKRLKLDSQSDEAGVLRNACSDLLKLFSDDLPTIYEEQEENNEMANSQEIEVEVLRQQEDSMSPRGVSDAIFNTSSSEEEGVPRVAAGEFVPEEAAPFLQTLPDLSLPPTDEFMLAETNEMSQFLSPSNRQYENIAFTPLRLPTQSQGDQDSPYNYATEAAERVLSFFSEKERETSPIDFSGLMKTNSIGRADVARIFFHSLVLHSKGSIQMTQNDQSTILINVTA